MVLKAIILVGGYGTRLRPLTFSCPKPLVEFCNKSIVKHQIDALVECGVKHVILCVNYKPKALEEALKSYSEQLGIKVDFSLEDVPMGTAGPLVLAKDLLDMSDPDPFFMLNADVTSEYPFKELLAFHKNHGKEGTIFVTKVDDPSKYGVVVAKNNGQIEKFVEKPQVFCGDKINAGMYIFNKTIVNRIPMKPTSIERVIFPAMAGDGDLFRMVLPGFWMDIGQPKDYLVGQCLKLQSLRDSDPKQLADAQDGIVGNVMIHESAQIGKGCVIGPDVVIGANVKLGDCVRLRRCSVFAGTSIANGAMVADSMVGWDCRIGQFARVQDMCVLGEDTTVPAERFMRSTRVCPHKKVKEDVYEDDKIII